MTILPNHKSKIDKNLDEIFELRLKDLDLSVINTLAKTAPRNLLPHLAASFDIQTNFTNENVIRELLLNAFTIKKGTVQSLKTALKNFFSDANIEEWFSYGGKPYYFKVKVLLNNIEFNAWNELENIVQTYKNVRSILESIEVELNLKTATQYIGSTNISGEILEIYPYQTKELKTTYMSYFGGTVLIDEVLNINLEIKNL